MPKKKRVEDQFVGTKGLVDLSAFHEMNLTQDKIREGLVKDLKMVYVFVAEVLHSKDTVDALAKVYWERYQMLSAKQKEEAKVAAPELFEENGKEESHGG